ncbi:MAG: hypothetical protein JWO73_249 [Candidatus Taylorbacteria bacterium]|nr:hypothetical protein [Candidatus Taylorbacteria bacterium]
MNQLQKLSVIAGIFFGIYPMLLSQGKASPFLSATMFTFVVWAFVSMFGANELREMGKTNWKMIVGAGVASGIGMLCFCGVLSKASKSEVAKLIVLMTIVQIVTTAIWKSIESKSMSLRECLGYATAAVTVALLSKKQIVE